MLLADNQGSKISYLGSPSLHVIVSHVLLSYQVHMTPLVMWGSCDKRENYGKAGQNGHLPILPKLSSKMPMFWNYLTKCLRFKLDFLKIELSEIKLKNMGAVCFQWKFSLNMLDFGHISTLRHMSKSCRVQWKFSPDTSSSLKIYIYTHMELEFYVKFLTLLDFHQIEFFIKTQFSKNRSSFKIRTFY